MRKKRYPLQAKRIITRTLGELITREPLRLIDIANYTKACKFNDIQLHMEMPKFKIGEKTDIMRRRIGNMVFYLNRHESKLCRLFPIQDDTFKVEYLVQTSKISNKILYKVRFTTTTHKHVKSFELFRFFEILEFKDPDIFQYLERMCYEKL